MRDSIQLILNNYHQVSSNETFADHPIKHELKKIITDIIEIATINTQEYKLKGSMGQGNWAEIPWIALFDKEITETATKGYDIVYLFTADMTGFYISLNQGWTYFRDTYGVREGRKKIETVANAWKKQLSSPLSDFDFAPIDLKGSGSLSTGYELGHICGKYYPSNDIPDDSVLINDLRNLMGVYRELKGKMINLSIEDTNNNLLVDFQLTPQEESSDGVTQALNTLIESDTSSFLLNQVIDKPAIKSSKHDHRTFTPRKIDFDAKSKKQKKIGLAGELVVLNYEKKYLEDHGLTKYANRVKHISLEKGDGAGYDILSFDLNGNERYIEVKTTTDRANTPFYLTENEVAFSKQYPNNFVIFRVYDFNPSDNTGSFYTIAGDLESKVEMSPLLYVVEKVL